MELSLSHRRIAQEHLFTIHKYQDGVVTCDGVLSEAESGLDNSQITDTRGAGAGHATVRVQQLTCQCLSVSAIVSCRTLTEGHLKKNIFFQFTCVRVSVILLDYIFFCTCIKCLISVHMSENLSITLKLL